MQKTKAMTLYHGSSSEIKINKGHCMYFTTDIEIAREFALGLDDCGNHNNESFIYSIEIDESLVTQEDDFGYFDSIGYSDYENMDEIVHNRECNFYCLKNITTLKLIENYKNEL